MNLDTKSMKKYLTTVCKDALNVRVLASGVVQRVDITEPMPNRLLVHLSTSTGPRFFEVHVKESLS